MGILYTLALSSLGIYGVLFAGWSANSKFAFLGSLRSTASMISYELILSTAVLIIILISGSLNFTNIIEHQQAVWFVIPLLPVFIFYFISILAETNRTPFDLPEADKNHYKRFGFFFSIIDILNAGSNLKNKSTLLLFQENFKFLLKRQRSENDLSLIILMFKNLISKIKLRFSETLRKFDNRNNINKIKSFNHYKIILFYINYSIFKLNILTCLFFMIISSIYINSFYLQELQLQDNVLISLLIPLKKYDNIHLSQNLLNIRSELQNVAGVYGLINKSDKKQYIGSSVDLFQRLNEHLLGNKSNSRLQRAIKKYGLDNFSFVIYYYHNDNSIILTDIETTVISHFDSSRLYNFKLIANSMLGYKHSEEALNKMRLRFVDKTKHPMFGRKHTIIYKLLISRPGAKNSMFGKVHSAETINKMSAAKNVPTGLYDINHNLIKSFISQAETAKYLAIYKGTVGRYIKSGKLFNKTYYIKNL